TIPRNSSQRGTARRADGEPIAARGRREARKFSILRALDEWNKTDGAQLATPKFAPVAGNPDESLIAVTADRHDEPAPFVQLFEQFRRDLLGRGGGNDALERRLAAPSVPPIRMPQADVVDSDLPQILL